MPGTVNTSPIVSWLPWIIWDQVANWCLLSSYTLFPINKDILLHNYNTTIKIRKFVSIYYYHPIKSNSVLNILAEAMQGSWPCWVGRGMKFPRLLCQNLRGLRNALQWWRRPAQGSKPQAERRRSRPTGEALSCVGVRD